MQLSPDAILVRGYRSHRASDGSGAALRLSGPSSFNRRSQSRESSGMGRGLGTGARRRDRSLADDLGLGDYRPKALAVFYSDERPASLQSRR